MRLSYYSHDSLCLHSIPFQNPANQWGYNPPGPGPPGARSAPPGYQPYNPGAVPTQSLPPGGYSQRPPPTSSLPPSGGYSQARPPPYTPQSLGYSQRPPPTSSYGGGYGYGQPPPPQPYGRAPTQPPPGVDPELWGWFQVRYRASSRVSMPALPVSRDGQEEDPGWELDSCQIPILLARTYTHTHTYTTDTHTLPTHTLTNTHTHTGSRCRQLWKNNSRGTSAGTTKQQLEPLQC